MFVSTYKSGHRKFFVRCRVGREILSLSAGWAAKIFSIKSHLTLIPPPPVINNDRSLRGGGALNRHITIYACQYQYDSVAFLQRVCLNCIASEEIIYPKHLLIHVNL